MEPIKGFPDSTSRGRQSCCDANSSFRSLPSLVYMTKARSNSKDQDWAMKLNTVEFL